MFHCVSGRRIVAQYSDRLDGFRFLAVHAAVHGVHCSAFPLPPPPVPLAARVSGMALVNSPDDGLPATVYVYMLDGAVLLPPGTVFLQRFHLRRKRPQQTIGSVEIHLYACIRLPLHVRSGEAVH